MNGCVSGNTGGGEVGINIEISSFRRKKNPKNREKVAGVQLLGFFFICQVQISRRFPFFQVGNGLARGVSLDFSLKTLREVIANLPRFYAEVNPTVWWGPIPCSPRLAFRDRTRERCVERLELAFWLGTRETDRRSRVLKLSSAVTSDQICGKGEYQAPSHQEIFFNSIPADEPAMNSGFLWACRGGFLESRVRFRIFEMCDSFVEKE